MGREGLREKGKREVEPRVDPGQDDAGQGEGFEEGEEALDAGEGGAGFPQGVKGPGETRQGVDVREVGVELRGFVFGEVGDVGGGGGEAGVVGGCGGEEGGAGR